MVVDTTLVGWIRWGDWRKALKHRGVEGRQARFRKSEIMSKEGRLMQCKDRSFFFLTMYVIFDSVYETTRRVSKEGELSNMALQIANGGGCFLESCHMDFK